MSKNADIAETAFQNFNWENHQWKLYLNNLYPCPPLNKIVHYKRKWFKNNINDALSLEPSQEEKQNTGSYEKATSPSSSWTPTKPLNLSHFYSLFPSLLLAMGFVFSSIYTLPFVSSKILKAALAMYISGFFLLLFSRYGNIQWTAEYWHNCVTDHCSQTIFITTATLILGSWVSLISPTFSAIVALGETSSQWRVLLPNALAFYGPLLVLIKKINMNRYTLLEYQARFEIYIGFFILLSLLLRYTSLMTALLYFNALRFKYPLSPYTQAAFREIHQTITFFLSKRFIPPIILSSYIKASSFVNSYTAH